MSLYNRVFGENKEATALLGMISCTRDMFMRYRDVYLNKEGNIITVLTRLGGSNRQHFKQVFTNIKRNENYIRDYDDEGDPTYCYIEFNVPEKYKYVCERMAPEKDRDNVTTMFIKEQKEAEIPGSEANKRMQAIWNEIINQSKDDKGNIHFIGL